MDGFGSFDWSNGTLGDQQRMARQSTPDQLRRLARSYDWRLYPEDILGWIMAQKSVDLGSALSAFLNGEPERFNYIPKRDVPEHHRAAARVLDNICLRVNSGFYLFLPGMGVDNDRRLNRWLTYQKIDRAENRCGRWILDERILETLKTAQDLPNTVAMPDNSTHTLLQDLLSPLKDLGVSREHLKYLPGD